MDKTNKDQKKPLKSGEDDKDEQRSDAPQRDDDTRHSLPVERNCLNKILCIALFVLGLLVGGVAVYFYTTKLADSHVHETSFTECLQSNGLDMSYIILHPAKPCNSTACKMCMTNVIAGHVQIPKGRTCPRHRINDTDCLLCNGSCLSISRATRLIGQHIKCDDNTIEIKCCDLQQMQKESFCGNHGEYICINNTVPPFCNCSPGWTGKNCDKKHLEKIRCKCFDIGIPIAYPSNTPACTDHRRPANWTECSLTDGHDPSKLHCICTTANATTSKYVEYTGEKLPDCEIEPS
ncbi:uncharacterized protein LOC128213680 isoform X2 [Mya arenaria]|uniref:uncharacterized protein LOC128213680 isoform X2 n=1 Tax=Mya arenaria TaxID=6604 RepID=UPI0022E76C20|nr:uncharacterized protein LOC128213680 isoform X2 [Mya arenaria]